MTYTRFLLGSTCCMLLLTGVSACNWLIPEDQSVPRYNTVQGERKRPLKNNVVPSNVPTPDKGAENLAIPAPVTPVAARDLPMEQPQKAAQAPLAPLPVPPVSPEVQAKANAQIAKDPALVAASGRQVPIENREFTIAQNTGAGLLNVPTRPVNVGMDSPSARLGDARRDLEQSRADALQAKTQLSNDVKTQGTAFPELSPLPGNTAPAPAAVPTPMPQPAPQARVEPVNVNSPSYIASVPLMPPPPLAPKPITTAAVMPAPIMKPFSGTPEPVRTSTPIAVVPATTSIAAAPVVPHSFNPMAPVPPAAPAMKPIQLSAPVVQELPAPVTATARATMPAPVTSLPPTSSDFNPLAGSQVASNAPAVAYLPPSRYASRH